MIDLIHGDCLEEMKKLPEKSVDSIVTDPPYELGFMGKSWDNTGIANNKEMWAEALRVLKPGGYLLAFSGTRTYHRMVVAIEDAGFEVRDMIEWVYGSGFPKSLNIGKAVDKLQGNEREDLGESEYASRASKSQPYGQGKEGAEDTRIITKGTSKYEGWGTALKPAHEPICMARKPLAEKTVAENCLKWGTGGINIDESRVATDELKPNKQRVYVSGQGGYMTSAREDASSERNGNMDIPSPLGRFPANLLHDNSEEVRECFPNESERFFKSIIYQAKASKSERNKGCEGLEEKQYSHDGREKEIENAFQRNKSVATNNHPTVKPIALMEYLITMVTPKGGTVLDPFMGSGSTGVAAKNLDRGFIGIDMTEEYIEIAKARINT